MFATEMSVAKLALSIDCSHSWHTAWLERTMPLHIVVVGLVTLVFNKERKREGGSSLCKAPKILSSRKRA